MLGVQRVKPNRIIFKFTDVRNNKRETVTVESADHEVPHVDFHDEAWASYYPDQARRVAAWLLKCERAKFDRGIEQ